MWNRIKRAIVLPSEVSDFENAYLARVNRLTVYFFLAHVPVIAAIAWFNDTDPLAALALTSLVAGGPLLGYRMLTNPRNVGLLYGFTSMLMGGLLVHFGQGPVQIEMHFYFFALLAMLALYGNPMAIVTAAATVATHHLLLWLFLPASVFNYDAPWWVVAVHAAFVVLESVATIYIARSFFDNVIGLEKVVQQRTAEVQERSQAMRLVLDNIDEGLMIVDGEGRVSPEFSAALARWFGEPDEGQLACDYLGRLDPGFGTSFEMTREQLAEDFLPAELTLDQAPTALSYREHNYRVDYRLLPAKGEEQPCALLLVIADVTAELERARLEQENRDMMALMDRIGADRSGFLEFLAEANRLLASLTATGQGSAALGRRLHTLKGNCMLFGVDGIANKCHDIETLIAGDGAATLLSSELDSLQAMWASLLERMTQLIGDVDTRVLELHPAQYSELLDAAVVQRDVDNVARLVRNLGLEPTQLRLGRQAEQAKEIAKRLGKGDIQVRLESRELLLDPQRWAGFWSSLVHVVRNAVDHGLERPEERVLASKPEQGCLTFATRLDEGRFLVEVSDDGSGIDWGGVEAMARSKGLPHETQSDLEEALFYEGLSTAKEVTAYSGRGVGLAAARQASLELGGSVRVSTEPGKGTRFEFSFPESAMAPSVHDLVANSELREVVATDLQGVA